MPKFLNSENKEFVEYLQECDLPDPRFYIKRDSLKEEDFHAMAEGTTWSVLSDPVGDVEPRRKFVFCECKKCGFRRNVRFADLKSKNTMCDNCLTLRLKDEAELNGCEYLGKSSLGCHYGLYKIKECGHILDIRKDGVRANNFRCKQCFIDSIYKACEGTTFEPVIEDGYSYQFKARCTVCGAISNKTAKRVGKCINCVENKEKELAKLHGANWLKRLKGNIRLYKLDCGHYLESQSYKVSTGAFECKQCINENLDYCASLSGASIIKHSSGTSGYSLCKLKCGCIVNVRRDAIYRGRIYCKIHDYSVYKEPSGIYLIKIKHGNFEWLKLGVSLDTEQRVSQYKLPDGSSYEILKYVKVITGYEAIKLESEIHKKYRDHNLDENLMKTYMKSGFTECYSTDIESNLLGELERIENEQRA